MKLFELFNEHLPQGEIIIQFPEIISSDELSNEDYEQLKNKLIQFSRSASRYINNQFTDYLVKNKIPAGYAHMTNMFNFDTVDVPYTNDASTSIIFNLDLKRSGFSKMSEDTIRRKKQSLEILKTFISKSLDKDKPLDRIAKSLNLGHGIVTKVY